MVVRGILSHVQCKDLPDDVWWVKLVFHQSKHGPSKGVTLFNVYTADLIDTTVIDGTSLLSYVDDVIINMTV